MRLEIGRVRLSIECSRFRLHPVWSAYSEDAEAAQDYYNYLWTGDVHWLLWWLQITIAPVSKSRGRWWWQRG